MPAWPRLDPNRRLAAAGAVALLASLLLPWYGVRLEFLSGFSQTGVEAFSFGHAALALVAAAALWLVGHGAGGGPPRPLSEGGLMVACGVWATLVVGFLALDRPAQIAGFTDVGVRYGAFVALGGALALAGAGLRLRYASRGPAAGAGRGDV
jgi:hypothetical protein